MKLPLSTNLWHSTSPVVKVTTVRKTWILWARAAFLGGREQESWPGPRPLKSEKPVQVPWNSVAKAKHSVEETEVPWETCRGGDILSLDTWLSYKRGASIPVGEASRAEGCVEKTSEGSRRSRRPAELPLTCWARRREGVLRWRTLSLILIEGVPGTQWQVRPAFRCQSNGRMPQQR